jgi:dTDP-4-dehydrorhamnose reductase
VRSALGDARPLAVAHLAYRRDERDTIVDGSANVARAAAALGARLVHVSTDVVFGGRDEPYTEHDRPDPSIDYGRHKLAAEEAVAALAGEAVIVRPSLLLATLPDRSPAQQLVVDAVEGRADLAFFEDEIRCPARASDVAAAVLALGTMPEVHGVLHVAGPRATSRAELARAIAVELGLDPARVLTSTITASGAHRPARVVLDSSRAAALGLAPRDPFGARVRPRSS